MRNSGTMRIYIGLTLAVALIRISALGKEQQIAYGVVVLYFWSA